MTIQRAEIIQKIRDLAIESGRPPGKQLFLKKTGISESQWYGLYWTSWGDALEEAGLKRNNVPEKISRESLLMYYALATRHFGKIPTKAELRMYRLQGHEMPADKTYNNTFLNKAALDADLSAYIHKTEEFRDLRETVPLTLHDSDSPTPREGYVYLLSSGRFFKIGRSDHIERRVKEISISLPERVDLIHTIRTDDPSGIEAYWHRRFADRRRNGEWFELRTEDIRAFKRRKYQ